MQAFNKDIAWCIERELKKNSIMIGKCGENMIEFSARMSEIAMRKCGVST